MGAGDGVPAAPGQAPPPGTYPPPPAAAGVTAPGGYPAVSPVGAAGPSSVAYGAPPAPQGALPAAQHAFFPEPAKPGAGYPPQGSQPYYPQQPQHGGAAAPAGYPGAGYPPQGGQPYAAPPSGYAPGVMGVQQAPGAVAGAPGGPEKCACSIGWVLFAFGFVFWPCWVAAAFVPLCTKTRNDRLAGLASTIGLLFLVVIGIIIGATSSRWNTNRHSSVYYG